jgi:hypothetical protein
LLYCELVIFVNFLYYKFVILVNLLYHELWTCGLCDLLSTLLYCEVWYVYRSYFRFRPLPVYFPHQTFVSDVSEIPTPFPILFLIKYLKMVMVLVFTGPFRPSSSLTSTLAIVAWGSARLVVLRPASTLRTQAYSR